MQQLDILIVDDEPQVAKSITRVLSKQGYRVLSTHSSAEALELIGGTRFKVVVADVKMSRMNGLELLDKVQEMDPDATRIVLSGHTDVALILKLVNARGIDKYLVKPWENEDLILAVERCVELYDLRKKAGVAGDKK